MQKLDPKLYFFYAQVVMNCRWSSYGSLAMFPKNVKRIWGDVLKVCRKNKIKMQVPCISISPWAFVSNWTWLCQAKLHQRMRWRRRRRQRRLPHLTVWKWKQTEAKGRSTLVQPWTDWDEVGNKYVWCVQLHWKLSELCGRCLLRFNMWSLRRLAVGRLSHWIPWLAVC